MFGLESLDIMIGLITIYLIFGMACTAIVEAVMSWTDVRSKNLEAALKEFFDGNEGTNFTNLFYNHPLVQSLSKGKNGRPSYIPPAIVSQVVTEMLTSGSATQIGMIEIKNAINVLEPNSRIRGVLDSLIKQTEQAGDTVEAFHQQVEGHFDNVVSRASGWVKRRSYYITLIASTVLVCSLNLDTINMINALAANPDATVKLVEIAQQQQLDVTAEIKVSTENNNNDALSIAKAKNEVAKATLADARNKLESTGIQLGWKVFPLGFKNFPFSGRLPDGHVTFARIMRKTFGLLVSIFAISLGAPFWFDMLQKVMKVRTSGVSIREEIKEKQAKIT